MQNIVTPDRGAEISDWNTIEESASYLRISDRQLRKLRKAGVVPEPTKLFGKKLYTREQLVRMRERAHIDAGFFG